MAIDGVQEELDVLGREGRNSRIGLKRRSRPVKFVR